MLSKYSEALKREGMFGNSSPRRRKNKNYNSYNDYDDYMPFNDSGEGGNGYFSLLLEPDYAKLEMKIRGLRQFKTKDKFGKENTILKKVKDHYLSEEGAEEIITLLSSYVGSDMKLGVLTSDEFLQTMDIIRKVLISFVQNNLYSLGMDTEQKQRKANTLCNMILVRIRQVLSRSISGTENERSHGDIKLTGELDYQKEDRFNMEDIKN